MPCSRPACPRELLRSGWLGKQDSLHQIETQLAHSEEISPGFDALDDSACSIAIGEVENSAAHRLFYRIVGAALYKVLINLDFNKWEVTKSGERGPSAPTSSNEMAILHERSALAMSFASAKLRTMSVPLISTMSPSFTTWRLFNA